MLSSGPYQIVPDKIVPRRGILSSITETGRWILLILIPPNGSIGIDGIRKSRILRFKMHVDY